MCSAPAPLDGTANDHVERVTRFFAAWSRSHGDLIDSFGLLADDCRWIQRPIPTLIGSQSARRFLGLARRTMGLETIDVEVLQIAANQHSVVVERIDHLRRADGSLIVSAPVVGVIEFRGDQVVRWREYFDSLEFIGRAAGSTVSAGLKSIARVGAKTVCAVTR